MITKLTQNERSHNKTLGETDLLHQKKEKQVNEVRIKTKHIAYTKNIPTGFWELCCNNCNYHTSALYFRDDYQHFLQKNASKY